MTEWNFVTQDDGCISGHCLVTVCVDCESDSDCPSQQFCFADSCVPQLGFKKGPCFGVSRQNLHIDTDQPDD